MRTYIIYLLLPLLFFSACQESKSSNEYISPCENSKINYPLKTGQKTIFAFTDITQNKNYYDDGYSQFGEDRNFLRSSSKVVEDLTYNLQWQDDEAIQEQNLSDAQRYCETLTLNNFGDWRLPNMYELLTLVNIGASTNSKESSFINMPYGQYYTSNILENSTKVAMVYFDRNDFNVSWEAVHQEQLSEYGILISIQNNPTYDASGNLIQLQTIEIYRNDENVTTRVSNSYYDAVTGIFLNKNSFISNIEPYNYETSQKVPKNRYVKCVRGDELDMGHFKRDDEKEIVTDTQTGLMWQDNLDVVDEKIQWGKSMLYCSNLELGGYKDWRVPTILELASIVNYKAESNFVLHDEFKYSCACKYHSSSDSCYDLGFNTGTCEQVNYQLNTCGPLPQRIEKNTLINENVYDTNDSEPYYRIRCVRCGYQAK
jgi:hypothetical protein